MTETPPPTPAARHVRAWPPYPAYRASGVDWLGRIPAHWMVKRLKYTAPISRQKMDEKPVDLPYLGLEHIESKTGRILMDETLEIVESVVNSFAPGDVLFGKLRPYLAKVACPDFCGVCTTELVVLQPTTELLTRFLHYQLLSPAFIALAVALTYGTKMPRVSPEQLADITLPQPPLPEQRAIAAFLDRETARLDALVAKKERLIALLRERRAALISHAVTRGLDPAAPTALEPRLGERFGTGWVLLPLKRWVSAKISDGPHETPTFVDDGVPFISAEAIQNSSIDLGAAKYVTEQAHMQYSYKSKPQRGDILLCKAGATTGKLAMVEGDFEFSIWSPLALIRAQDRKVMPRFLFYTLHAAYVQHQIKQSSGINTQPNIGMGVIEGLLIAAPPPTLQHVIVAYLDREMARTDALADKVNQQIAQLREYRTALIAAAVTGQIDVRATPAAPSPTALGE